MYILEDMDNTTKELEKVHTKLKLFSDAIKTSIDGIAIADLEGKVTFVNQAFEEMWGYLTEECTNMLITEFLEDKSFVINEVLPNTMKHGSWSGEAMAERKDRSTFPVQVTSSNIKDENGNLIAILVVFRDIAEKKHLEQQLIQYEKLSAMGQLAASVAHELGNPLSVIYSTIQYVSDRLNKEPGWNNKELDVVLENIKRMDGLLRRLKHFTRPEKLRFSSVNINSCLSRVLVLIAREIRQRGISYRKNFANNLSAVWGDSRQLSQVFFNICKNALEAMPSCGVISIKTRTTNQSEMPILGSRGVVVEVSDTGEGISQQDISLIFEPFFTTKKNGSGLGLFLSRRIIEEHRGVIKVESWQGKGTTFKIFLPCYCEGE